MDVSSQNAPSNEDSNSDHSCDEGDACNITNLGTVKLTATIRSQEIGLSQLRRGRRGLVIPGENIHQDIWDRVLCEGVPVSLRELVSLAASQLGLENNNGDNLTKLLQCSWSLGWHVTAKDEDGVTSHYWGGGVTAKTTSNYLRGDWIEIAGTEQIRRVETSRLARVICGVKIGNIKKVFGAVIRDEVWENKQCKKGDYVVYLLVRYASAHPESGRRRGPNYRPLCPGELQNTHALWKWHERPITFKRGCWRQRPWERHKHLFGDTHEQQELRKDQEKRAWYDVIQSSNVIAHANVQTDCDRPGAFLQSIMWC